MSVGRSELRALLEAPKPSEVGPRLFLGSATDVEVPLASRFLPLVVHFFSRYEVRATGEKRWPGGFAAAGLPEDAEAHDGGCSPTGTCLQAYICISTIAAE